MSTVGPPGRCRADTCRRPIMWAVNPKTGRRQPLDPEPSPTGNILLQARLDELPVIQVLAGAELDAARRHGTSLHVAHHATCPARQEFRR